jgi:hypothetical protein
MFCAYVHDVTAIVVYTDDPSALRENPCFVCVVYEICQAPGHGQHWFPSLCQNVFRNCMQSVYIQGTFLAAGGAAVGLASV